MNMFAIWYRKAFALAAGTQHNAVPRVEDVALKGLEEYVEFLFAAGAGPNRILAAFNQALGKEIARGTKPSIEGMVLEAADVQIVLAVVLGLAGIPDEVVDKVIDNKHTINEGRRWRINEFGSLSHIKDSVV